jgi:hypothetical protein
MKQRKTWKICLKKFFIAIKIIKPTEHKLNMVAGSDRELFDCHFTEKPFI